MPPARGRTHQDTPRGGAPSGTLCRLTVTRHTRQEAVAAGPFAEWLRDGDVAVRCGNREVRVSLRIRPGRGRNRLALPKGALVQLGVPVPWRLYARKEEGDALRLGPVVGVFASRRPGRRRGPRLFGVQTPFFRALARHGRRLSMLAYVFSPADIDWKSGSVKGFVSAGGLRRCRRLPLPDVVYDRIQSRKAERRESVQQVRKRLTQEVGSKWFPNGFLDKWETYELLAGRPEAASYLPRTTLLTGPDALSAILDHHRTAFLKPVDGSLGRGIIRIQALSGNRYSIRGARVGRRRPVRGLTAVWRLVARRAKERQYIVQQGLALATLKGRRFDVRVFLQQDAFGRWLRTKTFARVAAPGSLTSNLTRGGEAYRLASTLRACFGRRGSSVAGNTRRAGRVVATALEAATNGHLGECGVDLGIDRQGRVWLIEVNSKPFRKLDDPNPVRVRRSIDRPLGYARYLAGFSGPVLGSSRRRRRRRRRR